MPIRQIKIEANPYALDVRPDRLDLRDRPYLPPTTSLPRRYPDEKTIATYLPSYVKAGLILDQGQEGACTGFGLAAVINYLLWTRALQSGEVDAFAGVSAHMLYDLARFYDEWPGQGYEGSSCRGAMKGWHKHGVCANTLWSTSVNDNSVPGASAGAAKGGGKGGAALHKKSVAKVSVSVKPYRPKSNWSVDASQRPVGVYYRVDKSSVTDMQAAINDVGALYVSCSVHKGWSKVEAVKGKAVTHARLPRIPFDGAPADGGHAFAIVGFNEDGFVIQNSWSASWGLQGFAVLRYADWVANGTDVWVCALGVPQRQFEGALVGGTAVIGNRTRVANERNLLSGDSLLKVNPSGILAKPWDTATAYLHSVVAGNDGMVDCTQPDLSQPKAHVDEVVVEGFERWFTTEKPKVPRLVIYAHGGLNSESEAIVRARVLGPYFEGNGIFPVFYVWKTGIGETIKGQLEDTANNNKSNQIMTGALGDARDRLVEAIANGPLRWVWRQMKQNAEAAKEPDRAIGLLTQAIQTLQGRFPELEVHVLAHSAGSFVAGHVLTAGIPVSSLGLYAPACSLQFALNNITPKAPQGRTVLHLLSDTAEEDDHVLQPWLYGKSLLWLVSRGFEDSRKTPLAGFARTQDAKHSDVDDDLWDAKFWPDVQQWRDWVTKLPNQGDGVAAVELATQHRVNVNGKTIKAAHGGFDNDIDVVSRSINRILGESPSRKLTLPVEDLDF